MTDDQTPFDAFQQSITRRLHEMVDEFREAIAKLDSDIMLSNAQTNSRSVLSKLKLADDHLKRATDLVLGQGQRLASQSSSTTGRLWRSEIAERARPVLQQHADALFACDWRAWQEVRDFLNSQIPQAREQAHKRIAAEIDEFTAGVWFARAPAPHGGANITTNSVNINGNVSGSIIQQAGEGAQQSASTGLDPALIADALDRLGEAILNAGLSQSLRGEVEAEMETIRAQLRKPEPNRDILKIAGNAIGGLCTGVAGNMLTPYVAALLASLGLHT
jgi:hypothetical protein